MSPPRPEDPSIASKRDFGLGGVSVSSVSKHKKLGPPEFQNLISYFTDSDGFGKLSSVKFRLNTSASLRRGILVALGGVSLAAFAVETPAAAVRAANLAPGETCGPIAFRVGAPMDSLRFFDFSTTVTSLLFGIGWPPESAFPDNRLDLFHFPALAPSNAAHFASAHVEPSWSNVVAEVPWQGVADLAFFRVADATDSDGDGLTDYEELWQYGTNPYEKDTDGDGLTDGEEVERGSSPLKLDTDGDGLSDLDEMGCIRVSTGVVPIACDNVVADLTDAMRAASANSTCVDVALPQSVVLAGREYSRLTLDPNGIVYLRPADSTDQIPSYDCPDGFASVLSRANDCILMPYWSMLKPGATGFSVTVKETSDAYIVEYDNVSLDVEKALEWLKGAVEMPRPKLLAAASFLPYGFVSFQASIPKEGVSVSFTYYDFQYKFMDLVSGAASAIGVRNAGGFGSLIYATCQPQSVGDGYLVEFTLGIGSDPTSADTDGDGISDWEEKKVGRNPCDPSDGNTSKIPVFFIFGDPSNTHSEMYRVVVSPKADSGVGTLPAKFELDNSGCGVLNTKFALLERGWSYDVWLEHIGSTFEKGEEDFDYVIGAFASSPKIEIDDPAGLLGCNILVEKTRNFKAGGKVAEIHIPLNVKVDVEIDGVEEEKEETAGALVGFIPKVGADGSNPSAEWIKSLRPVVFRCESDDLLPGDELVVTAPAEFLYELKGDEYLLMPAQFKLAYSNFSERVFLLAGGEVSHTALDKEISFSFPLGQVEDVAKFTCFGLKFITPAGDPGNVDEECVEGDGQNEFVYEDDNVILGISLKVGVEPQLPTNSTLEGVFDMPNIANSLQWCNEDGTRRDDGSAVVSHSGSRFERLVVYTRYPETNSEFGRKTAMFTLCGVTIANDFEVFFPAFGSNHPPCKVKDELGCKRCPNWFYYWKEGEVCGIPHDAMYTNSGHGVQSTYTGEADFRRHRIILGTDAPLLQKKVKGVYLEEEKSVSVITNVLFGDVYVTCVATNVTFNSKEILVGAEGFGVRAVAAIVKHEKCHLEMSDSFSFVVDFPDDEQDDLIEDSDEDGVGDVAEETGEWGIVTDRHKPDTFGMIHVSSEYSSYGDNEIRARLAEENRLDEAYDASMDWAVPGNQCSKKHVK